MWILFAAASALFAGLSAIFGKYGVQGADSDIATAVRTIIVLVFAWLLVFYNRGAKRHWHYKLPRMAVFGAFGAGNRRFVAVLF